MLRGIVGFEMRVEAWVGKAKLGQNKREVDRRGAAEGLAATALPEAAGVAALMREPRGGG